MIVLIGSGGHGKVVLDALVAAGAPPESIRVRDGDSGRAGSSLLGIPVGSPDLDPTLAGEAVHVSIGNNSVRERLYRELTALGAASRTIVHPAAVIAASAILEPGAFAAAGAVVGPSARIGEGVIVNHQAVVDHDCVVGAWCHVAPGAVLGGGVRLGERVLIGSGASILPGIEVESDAVIGAGAVVTRNVPAGETWAGVPAAPHSGQ